MLHSNECLNVSKGTDVQCVIQRDNKLGVALIFWVYTLEFLLDAQRIATPDYNRPMAFLNLSPWHIVYFNLNRNKNDFIYNIPGLQNAFDHEWNLGYIKQEGWNQSASNEAILAYKLMVQTGRVENPVDKSLLTSNRLVKEDGIINPKAFYHYLTVWYNSDPLAYSASQVGFQWQFLWKI